MGKGQKLYSKAKQIVAGGNRNLILKNGKLVKKEFELYDDFDDFENEHESHRLKHQESLDYEAYEYDHYEKIEHEYVTESYSV